MATPDNLVVIYKELADAHERQGQPQLRDRFLVLAADAAFTADRSAEADLLLARLLRTNPHHMLRPFTSFREAMASADIQNYVAELRRTHPPEQAEEAFDALRAARGGQPALRPTRVFPPTMPVVNVDDPRPDSEPEPLKVYRGQGDLDATLAPPTSRPARPTPPPRTPVAPPKPPPRPSRPVPPAPDFPTESPVSPPSATDGDEMGRGSAISLTLFVLLLAAGLALAGWTLLWPFLPHG